MVCVMDVKLKCTGECNDCFFNWRNAKYNPDCFLAEMISHIVDKSDHVVYTEETYTEAKNWYTLGYRDGHEDRFDGPISGKTIIPRFLQRLYENEE